TSRHEKPIDKSCMDDSNFLPFAAICLSLALFSASAAEPTSESQTERLAKETQNPVANLITVPFQTNFNFAIGPNVATQWVLNVQPVIPINLKKDWNLIPRTIMPIINQPSLATAGLAHEPMTARNYSLHARAREASERARARGAVIHASRPKDDGSVT